jgi:type IV pilus assembly protein PilV
MANASSSESGFTLIEVMVSILILMVGLMGLLQTINLSIEHNMRNQLRNEGANLADAELAKELSKGYANVSTSTSNYSKTRLVMSSIQKSYSVSRSGSAVSTSKLVNFRVSWRYKLARYEVNVGSVNSARSQ